MKEFIVKESFVGLLYEDGLFRELLTPGKYRFPTPGFFARPIKREVTFVDMRERSLIIKGQEILTADKVAIRVSLLVYFKVKNAESAIHNVASYEDRIYEDVQLAARRYLASRKLEEILRDRNDISDAVREDVHESASSYGVEIVRADVKDLVFPGNLRDIMNRVLETERRTEAQLIEARKEAEVLRIRSEAQQKANLTRLEAEKREIKLKAEAEQESLRLRLQGELEAAKALIDNPGLLKLRQLEVLKELADSGGRFVIGFNQQELLKLMEE